MPKSGHGAANSSDTVKGLGVKEAAFHSNGAASLIESDDWPMTPVHADGLSLLVRSDDAARLSLPPAPAAFLRSKSNPVLPKTFARHIRECGLLSPDDSRTTLSPT